MDRRHHPFGQRLNAGVCLALLSSLVLASCVSVNPIEGTYKTGVEGGQRAIQKAKGVQQLVDQDSLNLKQQQKQMESGN